MIDLDDIERIAKQGVPYGLNADQLRRAVAWRDDKALALVARIRELEAQLATSDMAVSDLIDVFDREGLDDAICDAIRRHRAREGLE